MIENNGEYGDMPDAKTLMPAGHSRIDCAVRMVMKGKGYVDLLSSYGTLRITPLAVDLFRICFAKGQCREFPKAAGDGSRRPQMHGAGESFPGGNYSGICSDPCG